MVKSTRTEISHGRFLDSRRRRPLITKIMISYKGIYELQNAITHNCKMANVRNALELYGRQYLLSLA